MWKRCLILCLFLCGFAVSASAGIARDLSPPEAVELLRNNPAVYLLDVRTPGEYLQVRIPGSSLIPIDQLQRRIGELPKDRPILVYCAVGVRSSQVFRFLAGSNFPEVYNLYGGISAWQLRGFPVLQGPP